MDLTAFYVLSSIILIILVLFCMMIMYYEEIGENINDDQQKFIIFPMIILAIQVCLSSRVSKRLGMRIMGSKLAWDWLLQTILASYWRRASQTQMPFCPTKNKI